MNWFKHAFAVNAAADAEPTDRQRAVVDRLCREVVRRRMAEPALWMLTMSRPLNYITSQAMHFFAPIATVLFDAADYNCFATFLERRDSVDILCRTLEDFDDRRQEDRRRPQEGP